MTGLPPRSPAGWRPRPRGNAPRSAGPHDQRMPPGAISTTAPSPTPGPTRPTPDCWRPSATRRCTRPSPAWPPEQGQQLLALLIEDPPLPYTQISARLGIPAGSIGPTRRRCLHKLRRHPAIAALIDAEPQATAPKQPGPAARTALAAR
jgi:hypothetical protein